MEKLINKALFYGQRQIKSYKTRNIVRNIQSNLKGKIQIDGTSKLLTRETETISVHELNKNGFVE